MEVQIAAGRNIQGQGTAGTTVGSNRGRELVLVVQVDVAERQERWLTVKQFADY